MLFVVGECGATVGPWGKLVGSVVSGASVRLRGNRVLSVLDRRGLGDKLGANVGLGGEKGEWGASVGLRVKAVLSVLVYVLVGR